MMLSYIGKKMLFWGKTVKFCQNYKKWENICSIHISLTFSLLQPHRTKSRDYITLERYLHYKNWAKPRLK